MGTLTKRAREFWIWWSRFIWELERLLWVTVVKFRVFKCTQTRLVYCEKKLARLLFDFGVVNTRYGDCKHQFSSGALCLQQLTTSAARQQSCSVYSSCGLTPSWTESRINIWTYLFIWNQNISGGESRAGSECGSRVRVLVVFHSNYGSLLLSFRDMTTERTLNDGPTTDGGWQTVDCNRLVCGHQGESAISVVGSWPKGAIDLSGSLWSRLRK